MLPNSPRAEHVEIAKGLVTRSPTIRRLFEWLLARLNAMPPDERQIGWIEVSDIEGIFSYDRSVAIRVAKQLAEAGLGEYRQGRRGYPTRFEAKWLLSELVPLALGDPELRRAQEAENRKRHAIATAKENIAKTFGVSVDAVEIFIRL
jgi:hypothetical protein